MNTSISPILKAIQIFGSQRALAGALSTIDRNTSQAQISHWSTGIKPIPPSRCIPIEKATKGKVTRYQLRPDIFGAKP